ncbi:Serine carboxypeptidase-like 18 [Acorus calamus]|uniref:Serine carboxypeptidase-like 18 n=1 Tax=Acorus calamus TaxID=4465 RepID=A0AAV9CR54_ACOCL|nr:Serine carboxypeptidase-like 18 [Acorus calamus]
MRVKTISWTKSTANWVESPVIFNVEEYNGSLPTLVNNPNSWTKVANIIYIDAPIGTGYSYSKRLKSYATNDLRSSKEVYQFLIKWFADHPEFLSNSLYIGGDSYSGITVPVLTQEISNGIEVGNEPRFNLKGYLLGNPVTDRDFDDQAKVPYCHGVGLIPDELYELTKRSCNGKYVNPSNEQCAKCIDLVNESYGYLLSYYWQEDETVRRALHVHEV